MTGSTMTGSTMTGSIIPSALPPPEILFNNCGNAELVTDNRLKIFLEYENSKNCWVTLKLPETKTLKLTIDNFNSESCCDYLRVFDGSGTFNSKTQLKKYGGAIGDISYEWSGDVATFWWKTDRTQIYRSMTAYID